MTVGSISISMKPVESSSITAYGYDGTVGTLRITFKGGKTYDYKDVPQAVVDELAKAESVGSFINKNVVRQFVGTRLDGQQ